MPHGTLRLLVFAALGLSVSSRVTANDARDWRRTGLVGDQPTAEVSYQDIDGDGRPDILERWWNGKRARWLDENGDLAAGDQRGDQVGDLLQIDINGDGLYDGPGDQNIKWADNDGDGQADVQAFAINPGAENRGPHWMIFLDTDKDGVLGWENWETFDFDCWGYTGRCAWLPDYNGDSIFLKMHAAPHLIEDHTLNWENPFQFYDPDQDGATEMAMRWLDPQIRQPTYARLTGTVNDGFLTFDLDNDAAKDNEMDFDMTLRAWGGLGVSYRDVRIPLPAFKGPAKFDACFASNTWRRIDNVSYVSHEKGWETFFGDAWTSRWFVFDEDDDDHRWERVEMYYPTHGGNDPEGAIDLYSTKRWRNTAGRDPKNPLDGKPGLSGHPQADSIGDRGEFDADDSGGGKLYIGAFDGRFHLAGAEWGAWTVDAQAQYHGGTRIPIRKGHAPKVEEIVQYRDTDGNGFLDTVEFDYDGDRTIDLKVALLDYKTDANPHPDVAPLIDVKSAGWQGMHEAFTEMSNASWSQALQVYRAAWRRGLTTPELDRMANAASVAQRYSNAYWIKEKVFRGLRARLTERATAEPQKKADYERLAEDLKRLYYLGQFEDYVKRIADVPGL